MFLASLAGAFPVTPVGSAVEMLDADGDGRLDLIHEYGRGIRYGEPGRLGPAVPFVPTGAWFDTVGDLDGDGWPDLCFTQDDELRCALGYGRGYEPPFTVAAIDGTTIAVDYDSDGDLDLLTGIASGIELFENDALTFTQRTISTAWVSDWLWDDVTDDGVPDLVGSGWNQAPIAFPRMPDGTLGDELVMSGFDKDAIQFADANGDGLADAIYSSDGGVVRAFLKIEDQEYTQSSQILNSWEVMRPVDLDGDGEEDCLSIDDGQPLVWDADFGGHEIVLGEMVGGFHLATADIDEDGILDVVQFGNESQVLFDPLGAATTQKLPSLGPRWEQAGMAVGDVDNDGRPDIVYRDYLGRVDWIWNAGGLGFDVGGSVTDQALRPNRLRLADLNGDGALDVVVLDPDMTVFVGDGAGGFTHDPTYDQHDVVNWQLGELDGDAGWEAVLIGPGGVVLMQDDGSTEVLVEENITGDLLLADLDGDGLDDASVVSTHEMHLFRTSSAGVAHSRLTLPGEGVEHLWFDDDGDGDLDALVSLEPIGMVRLPNLSGEFFAFEDFRSSLGGHLATDGTRLMAQDISARCNVLGVTPAGDFEFENGFTPAGDELVLEDMNGDGLTDLVGLDAGVIRVIHQLDRFQGELPPEETEPVEPSSQTTPDTSPSEGSVDTNPEPPEAAEKASPAGCGCVTVASSRSWLVDLVRRR